MPKYPKAKVQIELAGPTGNAFVVMGRTEAALKDAGVGEQEIDRYRREAMSGDYNNLLRVTGEWVRLRVR
jgi:NAD(P)H-flavin reductase